MLSRHLRRHLMTPVSQIRFKSHADSYELNRINWNMIGSGFGHVGDRECVGLCWNMFDALGVFAKPECLLE